MEYLKIQSAFEFDPKTRKPCRMADVWNELRPLRWIATEKVDGTNVRVIWDGVRISFAGRTEKSALPPHLLAYLEKTFHAEGVEEVFEQVFGSKRAVVFGEGYGPKMQTGGELYGDAPAFIAFDVWIDGNWLSRANAEDVSRKLGLRCVPVMLVGTLDECYRFVEGNPRSTIDPRHEMEGVVCTTAYPLYDRKGNPVKVKVKARDIRLWEEGK